MMQCICCISEVSFILIRHKGPVCSLCVQNFPSYFLEHVDSSCDSKYKHPRNFNGSMTKLNSDDNNNQCHRKQLLAVTGEVTAGLELWRRKADTAQGGEGKSTADVAARLMGEFEGVQKAVRELQASFAKVS